MRQYWTKATIQRIHDVLYLAPPLAAFIVVVLTGTQHVLAITVMILVSSVFAAMLRATLRRRRG